MRIEFDRSYAKEYVNLPKGIKTKTDKCLVFLMTDFHHPSLHIKKMQGHKGIWEARITKGYRFTFQIIKFEKLAPTIF